MKESNCMSVGRDCSFVSKINEHYHQINDEMINVSSVDEFKRATVIRKAVLFDLLQIGELLHHLSDDFIAKFGPVTINSIISVRNRITHGYDTIDDLIIFDSIKNDIPDFIFRLNTISREHYYSTILKMIGKKVTFLEDKTKHSDEYVYGYIKELVALDGKFQGAYLFGEKSSSGFSYYVVAVIHYDDYNDKLILSSRKDTVLSADEIEKFNVLKDKLSKLVY